MTDDFLEMEKLGIPQDRRHGKYESRRWAIERALELNKNQGTTVSAIVKDAERMLHFVIYGRDQLRPGTEG
jgi:hypothetical protein